MVVINLGNRKGEIIMWEVCVQDTLDKHVMPVDDLRPHVFHRCWCNPVRDDEDDNIIIHNSMDQRECYERGEKVKS